VSGGARPEPGWVLWSGTVGLESPIAPRLEAATAAGCARVSLSPLDVARAEADGTSAADLGRRCRDAGLDLVLDPVMNWHGGAPRAGSRFGRFSTEEALRMAEALQVASMTVLAQPTAEGPVVELAGPFGAVCDRAADLGADVHLEFMPMTAVRDLAGAWAVVQAADRANGGIVFDTWHFFRGDPDYAVLEQVPGDRVFAVQVDDAHAEVRGTLREDTLHRELPGNGSFDLLRVVRALDRIGALRWVGPEVMSPVTAAMPAVEAARLAVGRVRDLVARARQEEPAWTT
jgi:sugar phosphate isomerase/epimerase